MKEVLCKECSEPIPWGFNESTKVHMKRQYCGKKCRDIARRKSDHPWNRAFKGGELY